ncbi:MAG: hypothetical protein V2A76_14240 [Planctomycetota bacterium]
MSNLPSIPGLKVLAETGRDSVARRFRLQGSGDRSLVLFHDPALAGAVFAGVKRSGTMDVDGLVRIEQVVQHGDLLGVVLAGELGRDLLSTPVLGELKSKPILSRIATILAGLFRQGASHGVLLPGGATLLDGGEVSLLPPVVLPGFLEEAVGAVPGGGAGADPAFLDLSHAGRDLSALAHLACHLIAGLKPARPAGVGGFPEALKNACSPATAQAVRILLESAGRAPSPAEALAVLERIGWAEGLGRTPTGTRARQPVNVTARRSPRAGSGSDKSSPAAAERAEAPEQRASTRKIPLMVGVLALALLGVGLLSIGAGGAMREFWTGRPRQEQALPEPQALLDRLEPPSEPAAGLLAALEDPSTDGAMGGAEGATGGRDALGEEATALADQILQELADKRKQQAASSGGTADYDRSQMREGNQLLKDGKAVLAELREAKLSPAEKNAQLKQAIALLEKAREKYESFIEHSPARERLVQGSLEDANALIFFAYRQLTVK